MSIVTLQSLFGYKAWANAELFELLASVPAEHADRLHACIRTLNHVYVADSIFRAHLSGKPRPFDATNTQDTPSLKQLRADVSVSDAWYLDYVFALNESAAAEVLDFQFTDGDRGRMSREEMLLHVATHSGYHRGNVGERLGAIGIAAPRDVYTKFLHLSEPERRGG